MAKLPPQTRILKEDLKDAPSWVNGIIEPFNNFAENIYQAMNRSLTFTENTASFVKDLVYITPSTYPTVDVVEFANTLKMKAIGVWPMQAVEKLTYEPAAGPVYVPWVENNGVIRISSITGLAAGKTYLIRLLVC